MSSALIMLVNQALPQHQVFKIEIGLSIGWNPHQENEQGLLPSLIVF